MIFTDDQIEGIVAVLGEMRSHVLSDVTVA